MICGLQGVVRMAYEQRFTLVLGHLWRYWKLGRKNEMEGDICLL